MNISNQADLRIEISVPATPAECYKAIGQVRDWWTRDTEGESSDFGDEFTVRFRDTFVTFKVTQAESDIKSVWHVTDCFLHWTENKTEWTGTDLIWKVAASEGGSLITMVHQGLTPEVECYSDCRAGWEHFVTSSLFKLITEGVGLPEGEVVRA